MMKILSGATMPDGGNILLDGRPAAISSPSDAVRPGIRTVYQELVISASRRTSCSAGCRPGRVERRSTGRRPIGWPARR